MAIALPALPLLHGLNDDPCGQSVAEHEGARLVDAEAAHSSPHCAICHWWQSAGRFNGASAPSNLTPLTDLGLVVKAVITGPTLLAVSIRPARAPPLPHRHATRYFAAIWQPLHVRRASAYRGSLGRDHVQPIRLVQIFVLSAVFAAAPRSASAQAADPQALRQEIDQLKADIETLRQQYSERLSALEARLASLDQAPPAQPDVPPAQPDTCRQPVPWPAPRRCSIPTCR